MNFKTMIVLAAFAAAGGSAYAQGMGQGGGGPTPEMKAARDAMRQACAPDAKALCDGKAGRDQMMCLRENAGKVSDPCKDAMSRMPHRQRPPEGAPAPQ